MSDGALSRDSRLGQRKGRATPALRLGCLRELHYPPVGQAIGICLGDAQK